MGIGGWGQAHGGLSLVWCAPRSVCAGLSFSVVPFATFSLSRWSCITSAPSRSYFAAPSQYRFRPAPPAVLRRSPSRHSYCPRTTCSMAVAPITIARRLHPPRLVTRSRYTGLSAAATLGPRRSTSSYACIVLFLNVRSFTAVRCDPSVCLAAACKPFASLRPSPSAASSSRARLPVLPRRPTAEDSPLTRLNASLSRAKRRHKARFR